MTMERKREELFRIALRGKDMKWESFCTGGKGGQNQNKRKKGVRIRHLPSGAIGEGREFKSKAQNEKAAIRRLVDSKRFKTWVRLEAAAKLEGYRDIEEKVDKMMSKDSLQIEVMKDGEWTDY